MKIIFLYKEVADTLKMQGIKRGSLIGLFFWEFELYGKLSSNQIVGSGIMCPNSSNVFHANVPCTTYQWQLDSGGGFVDINDNSNYTGTHTAKLTLNNIPFSWYGYQFRCIMDTLTSSPVTLRFSSTWMGTADTLWENPANWSCGELPDANTDVIVNSGTIIVQSNPNVRSLTLGTGVNFMIKPDFIFTINH